MTMRSVLTFCALALGLLSGCTMTRGARVRDDLAAMRVGRDPERLVREGEAFAQIGDASRAAEYFALAIQLGYDETVVLPRLVQACVQDRQYRNALAHAEGYLRRHPTDASLRFVVGALQEALGEPDTARKTFEEILRTAPGNADVHYALAVLLRDEQRNPVEADAHFRRYLDIDPNGPHAEEARGSLLRSVR
jgi:tetratricopeptide (TPR) repeat protein